jgi:hypothetical protein
MNEKPANDRREIIIKVRMSQREWTRAISMASVFAKGNLSKLIRHALDVMPTRPEQKEKIK